MATQNTNGQNIQRPVPALKGIIMADYWVYVIHEGDIDTAEYTKIGITMNPLRRLALLQIGNPRPLRSPDYSRRPHGEFGYRCASKADALEIERRALERLQSEGCRIPHDLIVKFDPSGRFSYGLNVPRHSEWVQAKPRYVDQVVLTKWHDVNRPRLIEGSNS